MSCRVEVIKMNVLVACESNGRTMGVVRLC